MARSSYTFSVDALSGFEIEKEVLDIAVANAIQEFYGKYSDDIYLGCFDVSMFDIKDGSLLCVGTSRHLDSGEIKYLLKRIGVNIATSAPDSAFSGYVSLYYESVQGEWTYIVEYANKLLSIRGIGVEAAWFKGECQDCGCQILSKAEYHPDNVYYCPECGEILELDDVEWDSEFFGDDCDIIRFGNEDEIDSIEELIIPEGITFIPYQAYSEWENLKRVVFPKSLKIIDDNAFAACTGLEEIILPDNLVYFGGGAFSDCSSLKKIILSSKITRLSSLDGCSSLEEIDIPGSVNTIECYTTAYCESLKRITVNEGTQKIEYDAFSRSEALSELILPASLEEIEELPFDEDIKDQITIFAPKGSYAEEWALENGIGVIT